MSNDHSPTKRSAISSRLEPPSASKIIERKGVEKTQSQESFEQLQSAQNWQVQDNFVFALEEELATVDPLAYAPVGYHKHEWDNIPPVVPKFVIHLSKYVEAMSKHAHSRSLEETTAELRAFAEKSFSVSFIWGLFCGLGYEGAYQHRLKRTLRG